MRQVNLFVSENERQAFYKWLDKMGISDTWGLLSGSIGERNKRLLRNWRAARMRCEEPKVDYS